MRTKNVIINNCLSKSDWVMTRLESEVERANHMYDESSVWRSKFQFDLSDGEEEEEEEEEKDSNERKITVLQREGDEQGKPFLLTWLKNKRCVIEKGGSEKREKKASRR